MNDLLMIFLFMMFSGKDFTEFVRFFDSLYNNKFYIFSTLVMKLCSTDKSGSWVQILSGSGQRIVFLSTGWLHSHRLVVSEVGILFDLIWTLTRTYWSGSASWTSSPSSPLATGWQGLSIRWLAVT